MIKKNNFVHGSYNHKYLYNTVDGVNLVKADTSVTHDIKYITVQKLDLSFIFTSAISSSSDVNRMPP